MNHTRVKQDQREHFSDLLQKQTKSVQTGIADPETRKWLIKSQAFKNANFEYKKFLGPLKVRSAPMDGRILHTMDIETFEYNIEACVGEAISKNMRRHQNAKCFNCGRICHVRRDCTEGISINNVSFRMTKYISIFWIM